MLKKNKFLYITIFYTLCLPIQIQANWHKVHEDGFFSLYIDKHNVKFFGDSRKIMELQNLSKVNYKGELSYRYISEYDCGSKKWRIIYEERFADRMASGKLLSRSASFDEWNEIPKNTAAEKVFSFICWKEYFLTEIGIVTKLNDANSKKLSDNQGLNISEINSFARKTGLRIGDYISHINNVKINSIKHVKQLLKDTKNKPVVLRINRNGASILILVKSLKK